MQDLDGSTAVVTGAAKGIGHATATALARAGATVLAIDRDPVTDVGPLADRLSTRVADLGRTEELEQLAGELSTGQSPVGDTVDILVNCAAAYPPGGVLEAGAADWQRVMQVNVVAAATLARAVAMRLIDQERAGVIVNVGSVQAQLPLPGYAAYVTSKGAIDALTRALAVELGGYGIRVNGVAPGIVNSPTAAASLGASWGDEGGPPAPTLLERAGTPDEVADAISYLASTHASYITGAMLPVDGGRGLSRRYDSQVDPTVGVPGGPGGGAHAHR